ncbi:MAG: ABC transporter ATP-binding protein [bacterium]|jgi:phospholipid/cholesterol/gamma-HCH transport system ATP-binding protein
MIKIHGLCKSFDGHQVLQGVSLQVEEGEVLALIGMSGFGKSVLLKHVIGLMRPDRGQVLIGDQDIFQLRGRALERMRTRFGFLFQGGALFDSLTVFENVAFPLREKTKKKEAEIRERVLFELEQVAMTGAVDKYPAELSGGMKKRAALARALIMEPEIMLFDEPTTGLDPITASLIHRLIYRCHERLKFTGIIVSHEIPRIFEIVDRVALLNQGVIVEVGTPAQIQASTHPEVVQFISGATEGPIECQ